MIAVEVRQGDIDEALRMLRKKVGPHLKAIARRAQFSKPSERIKLKESIARKRKKKTEKRWKRE